jgi:hypothetical protein
LAAKQSSIYIKKHICDLFGIENIVIMLLLKACDTFGITNNEPFNGDPEGVESIRFDFLEKQFFDPEYGRTY